MTNSDIVERVQLPGDASRGAPLLNVTGPAYASYYLFSHQTEIEANPSASKYSTRIV